MADTFERDIILGEEIEIRLLGKIKKKYPKSYKVEGEFKPYDLCVPEKDICIEVKRDIGSNLTDNYFIEASCNGKPSGITSSKAHYWVIYDENKYIWIKHEYLMAICKVYGKHWSGIPNGGVSIVEAYLIPKEYILKYSCKIHA